MHRLLRPSNPPPLLIDALTIISQLARVQPTGGSCNMYEPLLKSNLLPLIRQLMEQQDAGGFDQGSTYSLWVDNGWTEVKFHESRGLSRWKPDWCMERFEAVVAAARPSGCDACCWGNIAQGISVFKGPAIKQQECGMCAELQQDIFLLRA